MRPALAVLAVLALVLPAALALSAGATASERLDALAGALREDELAVHPDLLWLLDADERDAVEDLLADLEVPVLVAVVPLLDEDESGGDYERVLVELIERTGRPGLYVVIDQSGGFDIESDRVPRDILVDFDLAGRSSRFDLPEEQRPPPPTETVVERLEELVAVAQAAPPGTPDRPDRDLRPIEPLYANSPSLGSDTAVATVVGGVLGLMAYGFLRFFVVVARTERDAG